MRVFSTLSAIFFGAIIFLTMNAEAESCQYENFTVQKGQEFTFDNEDIWLCGDILIDGTSIYESKILQWIAFLREIKIVTLLDCV